MNLDFRLIELFDTLPNVTEYEGNSFKSSYDFGTKEDLNRFLQSMKRENSNPYPLIWLITPYDEQPQDVKASFETEFNGLRAICLNGGGFNSDVFKSV